MKQKSLQVSQNKKFVVQGNGNGYMGDRSCEVQQRHLQTNRYRKISVLLELVGQGKEVVSCSSL